jgi:hypothetical protein
MAIGFMGLDTQPLRRTVTDTTIGLVSFNL